MPSSSTPPIGSVGSDAPTREALALLGAGALTVAAVEIYGVWGPKPQDCYSELWRFYCHRSKARRVVTAGLLGGLLFRLWWHLTIEEGQPWTAPSWMSG